MLLGSWCNDFHVNICFYLPGRENVCVCTYTYRHGITAYMITIFNHLRNFGFFTFFSFLAIILTLIIQVNVVFDLLNLISVITNNVDHLLCVIGHCISLKKCLNSLPILKTEYFLSLFYFLRDLILVIVASLNLRVLSPANWK